MTDNRHLGYLQAPKTGGMHTLRFLSGEVRNDDDARLTHVHWVAARLLEGAKSLLTQAQLREEELIENLVSAKTACDETVAPAEAVLAAAKLVEELEQHIDTLTQVCDETRPSTVERGDDQ